MWIRSGWFSVVLLACGSSSPSEQPVDGGSDEDASSQADASTIDASPTTFLGRCGDPVPQGAMSADAPPIYSGTCPALVAGRNSITSGGNTREFVLIIPETIQSGVDLPLFFMWHWLGGDADGFVERGELQLAANQRQFIAIVPEAKGDLQFRWPIAAPVPDSRIDEEVAFFDDMLACAAEQLEIDTDCVSTVGVSAGALWSSQLAPRRSRHIASVVSLSGGVSEDGDFLNPVKPWVPYERKTPALVLWGGPTDFCGINFDTLSTRLEDHMTADGHYVLECVHNCAHSQPPTVVPEGTSPFDGCWQFVLDHPFWVSEGRSVYDSDGLPTTLPSWCAAGAGNATIRSGECESGALGDCL